MAEQVPQFDKALQTEKLLQSELRVVNVGLQAFARDLERAGTPVIQVEWSPPAVRDPKLLRILAKLGG